jgi:hypothetical protein
MTDREITLKEQIACVKRELTMRDIGYPRLVLSEKMKSAKAKREIAAMRAVLQTLMQLEAGAEFRREGKAP